MKHARRSLCRAMFLAGALLAGLATARATGPATATDVTASRALRELLPVFVTVSAGTFRMGSPHGEPGSRDDERPLHDVVLTRDYQLAATEVTQALWRAVMGDSTCYFIACGERCPAESMSWFEAVAFCNALSASLGYLPAYVISDSVVSWDPRADGFRLPTEAEWEYACRAGTRTPFGTGACLATDAANFDGYHPAPGCERGMFRGEPMPVASFPPNPWGLYDMHGNVHEWCWDAGAPYGAASVSDPTGPDGGDTRCLRGGGWISHAAGCRSGIRYLIPPGERYDFVGLRLARSSPERADEEAGR